MSVCDCILCGSVYVAWLCGTTQDIHIYIIGIYKFSGSNV